MTIKKVRWLWSYKLDKTEKWLAEMAEAGWHLSSVNRGTRTFTFIKGEQKRLTYRIQYAPKGFTISASLQKAGWKKNVSEGKWIFLSNEEPLVRLFPTRDAILKRNRVHAYLVSGLVIFQLGTQMPLLLVPIVFLSMEEGLFFGNMWFFLIVFAQAIGLSLFATYIFRAYRRFEISEMDAKVDQILIGKKVRKFKGGWMYDLEATKAWLEELAKRGLELEKVAASLFTFRKTEPSNIKYECTFEYKVQPSYFITHKELGWNLKYSSNMTLLNYSIWSKHYIEDEKVPQFSYDKAEKRQAVKRAFKMNIGMSIYLIVILSFSLYINTVRLEEQFVSLSFGGIMRPLLLITLIIWLFKFIQILISYRKTMNVLH